MMNRRLYRFAISLVVLMASLAVVRAEDWKQGSVAVLEIGAGVDLLGMGQSDLAFRVQEVPTYVPGLLVVKTAQPERVSMLASNGVLIDFKGAGYFAIERFEQEVSLAQGWLEAEQEAGHSRMILNLRAGTLIMDQHKLALASQAIVETPVGRFSGGSNSLWLIQLTKDARKRTFSFNVFCIQGKLRFFDLMGRTFTINSGQRISGAGSALTPSVEVAGITSDAREYVDDYMLRAAKIHKLGLTEEGFLSATRQLELHSIDEPAQVLSPAEKQVIASEKRPLVIEYAPRSAPVTPFQGVARPPSAYEADLF